MAPIFALPGILASQIGMAASVATGAATASITPFGAAAVIGGGTGLQVYSTLREGKEAAREGKRLQLQGRYDQLAEERRARITERAGLDEQRRLKEVGKRLKSAQIVSVAAGGGRLTGTALKAIVRSAANVEHDVAKIGESTGFEAEDIRHRGRQKRFRGDVAKFQGRLNRYGSRIRAMTAIGSGVGRSLQYAHLFGRETA